MASIFDAKRLSKCAKQTSSVNVNLIIASYKNIGRVKLGKTRLRQFKNTVPKSYGVHTNLTLFSRFLVILCTKMTVSSHVDTYCFPLVVGLHFPLLLTCGRTTHPLIFQEASEKMKLTRAPASPTSSWVECLSLYPQCSYKPGITGSTITSGS